MLIKTHKKFVKTKNFITFVISLVGSLTLFLTDSTKKLDMVMYRIYLQDI